MFRNFIVSIFVFLLGMSILTISTSLAVAETLSKQQANVCVKQGLTAFFAGKRISGFIDIPFMKEREKIKASNGRIATLLNKRAAENRGWYQLKSKYPVTSTKPTTTKAASGYTIAYGQIKGLEFIADQNGKKTNKAKKVSYKFTVWIKIEEGRCKFGVIAIEEVFRLGGWVKDNT